MECGTRYGQWRGPTVYAHWFSGRSDTCGVEGLVADPEDFGHLLPGWTIADKGHPEVLTTGNGSIRISPAVLVAHEPL